MSEPGDLPTTGIHRVLVCRPNHRLGNTILISPLIAEIEALYPGAQIDILGSSASESLYADRFRIHRVFVLPQRIARHLWTSFKALHALRRSRYDLAIDACQGSQSGRLVLALSQARYKLGFPDRRLRPDSAWHALAWPAHLAHRNVFLLRRAYAGTTRRDYPPLNLDLSPREKEEASRVLSALCANPPNQVVMRVAIFPNATGAKCYGREWWSRFVETFQSLCPQVRLIDLLAAHGESQLDVRLTPFYSQNLRRLAAMIACMDGFISADCGVMHLAAASGTPTLGLFSVTDPSKYAPYGNANSALDTRTMDAVSTATAAAQWLDAVVAAQSPPQRAAPRAPRRAAT